MARQTVGAAMGLAAVILAASTSRAQTPPRDAGAQGSSARDATRPAARPSVRAASGSLSGRVVADADGSAIRSAYVVLIGTTTGGIRVTSSGNDGEFSVTGLPADRYLVGVSKPPFLGAVAGARRPGQPGTPVTVADGQTTTDIIVRMFRGAAIAGTITNQEGAPAAGATVGLQQRRMEGNQRVLASAPVGNATTDERGRYRFFGLPPGDYAVVVVPFGPGAVATLTAADVDAAFAGRLPAPPVPTAAPIDRFSPIYFPGTAREEEAALVSVGAGDERQGVDIPLQTTRTASVDGAVVGADGAPVAGAMVLVTRDGASPSPNARTARQGPDGSFRVANLGPGSYTFVALDAGQATRFASARIEINGADVGGLRFTLGPLPSFQGRIAFSGAKTPPALSGRRADVRPIGSATAAVPLQIGNTDEAGVFKVTRVLPGAYLVGGSLYFGANADSVSWSLQSVVADGRDVTDLPVMIDANAMPKDIVLTYTDVWQDLSGRLTRAGLPSTDYSVVLFPTDRKYWVAGSRRILVSQPATDGSFHFGGPGPTSVAPGTYWLAAVSDLGRNEHYDPSVLDQLAGSAIRIVIASGERKTQDVAVK